MKIIYVNRGVKKIFWRKIIAVIYATFAVAKRKPEKNSGLYGIRIRFQERAREPLGCFFTLNKPAPRLIRMLVSNWAQKLFLCPVNRRPESIELLYLQCKLDYSPYRECLARVGKLSSRRVFSENGAQSQRNSTILQHVTLRAEATFSRYELVCEK